MLNHHKKLALRLSEKLLNIEGTEKVGLHLPFTGLQPLPNVSLFRQLCAFGLKYSLLRKVIVFFEMLKTANLTPLYSRLK